jgi:hypothetical protein
MRRHLDRNLHHSCWLKPRAASSTGSGPRYGDYRGIKAKWFVDFPWLSHNTEKKLFFCKCCVDSKRDNIFVKGRSSLIPKRDDFTKHETRKDHKLAITADQQRKNMVTAVRKATSKMEESVVAVMRTILCMGQADIPNSMLPTLVDLQIENVGIHVYDH